jgi:hypothetical protein
VLHRSTVTDEVLLKKQKQSYEDLPQVLNMDAIAVMADDELFGTLSALDNALQRVFAEYGDTKPWEVEIAYVRRELQVRRLRREKHNQYMENIETETRRNFLLEAMLPDAGYATDNTHFLRFIGAL